MNLLSRIAISNLKTNKYKSVLLIITIGLLTIILTNIGIVYGALSQNNQDLYLSKNKSFEAIYKGLSYKDVLKVKGCKYLDNVGIGNEYAISKNNKGINLNLVYLDKTSLDLFCIELIQGRLPKEKNEIVIQKEYLEYSENTYKIGDNIEISYNDEGNGKSGKEVFKIVGILKSRVRNHKEIDYLGVISSELIDKGKNNFNTYINIKQSIFLPESKVREKVMNIANKIGVRDCNVKINYEYIAYKKYVLGKNMFFVAIGLVILLSCVIVIYSIFNISIVLNSKEFGKLKILGTTKGQIRSILLREVLIVSCISIPIGLIIGYFCSKIILLKILELNSNIENLLKILSIVVIITLLMIIISIIIPIKIAEKISPVEAANINVELNNKAEKRGFLNINIKTLTYDNIFRDKIKINFMLVSSLVSAILVMTLSILLLSLKPEELAQKYVNGDLKISLKDLSLQKNDTYCNLILNNPLGEILEKKLQNLPGVLNLNVERTIIGEVKSKQNNIKRQVIKGEFEQRIYNIQNGYLKEKVNYDELIEENGVIIGSLELASNLGVKIGDNITVTFYDGNNKINKDFLVKYICRSELQCIIVPNELISDLEYSNYITSIVLEVDDNYYDYIKEYLRDLAYNSNNIIAADLRFITNMYKSNYKIVKWIMYLLLSIVSIVCSMNHVNNMITSIIIRKREIGILQTVGLSKKQLIKMFRRESLFYTSRSIIIIFVFSNIYAYVILGVLRYTGVINLKYKLSITLISLVACILLIGHFILTFIATRYFYKESLINQLKYNK